MIRYARYPFRSWDSFLGLQFYKILSRFLRRAGEIMFRILNITRYYDGKWLTKQLTTVAIAARESFFFREFLKKIILTLIGVSYGYCRVHGLAISQVIIIII